MRDFNKLKQHLKANASNPNMGLHNKPCKNPAYWCRLHEVWLSEADVSIRQCKSKLSADMIERKPCSCLEKKNYNEFTKKLRCH